MDTQTRNKKYMEYVSKITPRTPWWPSLLAAFVVGGIICVIGELLLIGWGKVYPEYTQDFISSLASITLIAVAAILTGLGLYDKIGTFAGGGSVVPITGFSNSITSAAIEFRKEGIIFGTCANMFKIAGPVIVVGLALSMLVGAVYYVIGFF